MITIVDYGVGNLQALARVYEYLNIPVNIASSPIELGRAVKMILPGVGAFDHAMESLNRSGMKPILEEKVMNAKVPVLGICLGMQMLADGSEEGRLPGLGWIKGTVKKMNYGDNNALPLPHMGWNNIEKLKESKLLSGLNEARFYFLHSYHFDCIKSEDVIAITHYEEQFTSVVGSGNVYGVQFHPEKSHDHGVQLLKNFASLC